MKVGCKAQGSAFRSQGKRDVQEEQQVRKLHVKLPPQLLQVWEILAATDGRDA